MVVHWLKNRGPHWFKSALVNGLGALVTGITVVVVLVAKFAEGAWITLLFIPLTIVFFMIVRRHYHYVRMLTACKVPVQAKNLSQSPIVESFLSTAGATSPARESNLRPGFLPAGRPSRRACRALRIA